MLDRYSNTALSENILFEIARGAMPGFTPIIQSFESTIGDTLQTAWPQTTEYVFPSSAIQMTVSSESVDDTDEGTGLNTIFIAGLDANYDWIYEIVTLNGLNPVSTVNSYYRINKIYGVQCGSTGRAQGNIYIGTGTVTAGVPATIYSQIQNTGHLDNNSQQGIFTVPAGHSVIIPGLVAGVGKGKDFQAGIYAKPLTTCEQKIGVIPLYENTSQVTFSVPLVLPEKTDITIKGVSIIAATTTNFSGGFTIILERKDKTKPFIYPGSLITSTTWFN